MCVCAPHLSSRDCPSSAALQGRCSRASPLACSTPTETHVLVSDIGGNMTNTNKTRNVTKFNLRDKTTIETHPSRHSVRACRWLASRDLVVVSDIGRKKFTLFLTGREVLNELRKQIWARSTCHSTQRSRVWAHAHCVRAADRTRSVLVKRSVSVENTGSQGNRSTTRTTTSAPSRFTS